MAWLKRLLLALLLIVAVGAIVYAVWFIAPARQPSLVDDLKQGSAASNDIASLDYLLFRVRQGWPFTQEDYAKLKSQRSTDAKEIATFARIIASRSTPEPPAPAEHPTCHYFGILRVNMNDGSHYYVYYEVMEERGEEYTYVRANGRNAVNPNAATRYFNRSFAEFLRNNDPWYRTAEQEDASAREQPASPSPSSPAGSPEADEEAARGGGGTKAGP